MARPLSTLLSAGRAAGGAMLALALAGCMDVEAEVAVLDARSARVSTTATMTDDMFTLLAAQTGGPADLGMLCADAAPVREGGRVSCATTLASGFAQLPFAGPEPALIAVSPVATGAGAPPRVRVELSTAALRQEITRRAGAIDPRSEALASALFAGHAFTFSVSGGTVHATNMERVADGGMARADIALETLLDPTVALPRVLYATIDLTEPTP